MLAHLRDGRRLEILVSEGVRQQWRLLPVESMACPSLGEIQQRASLQLAELSAGQLDWA
jgi:hypothetical protein